MGEYAGMISLRSFHLVKQRVSGLFVLCIFLFGSARSEAGSDVPRGFFVYPSGTALSSKDFGPSSLSSGGPALLGGVSASEAEITPEIQNLARALQYDPKQIFEYVRNNIEYVPLSGSRNGATATLLAGRGNDIDQCSLLIALLRAANPATDACYVNGDVGYQTSFIESLLNVSSSQIIPFLTSCRVPADMPYGLYTVIYFRFWVEATIDGAKRVLDPAFKEYEYFAKMDGLSAMGYNRTQFIARSLSGSVVTSDSIRNVNEMNIRSDLASYSLNLMNYMRTNHVNDSFLKTVGGRRIVPEYCDELPTDLPYKNFISWQSSLPSLQPYHFLALQIQHCGINRTFYGYEIAGKRVSIFYTGAGNSPELRVDGSLIQTGTPTTTGQINNMRICVSTPTTSTQTNNYNLISGTT